jgi:hypothetical protein
LWFILFPANAVGDLYIFVEHRAKQVLERLHAAARIAAQSKINA